MMLRWALGNWSSVAAALKIPERTFHRQRKDSLITIRKRMKALDPSITKRVRAFAKTFKEEWAA